MLLGHASRRCLVASRLDSAADRRGAHLHGLRRGWGISGRPGLGTPLIPYKGEWAYHRKLPCNRGGIAGRSVGVDLALPMAQQHITRQFYMPVVLRQFFVTLEENG